MKIVFIQFPYMERIFLNSFWLWKADHKNLSLQDKCEIQWQEEIKIVEKEA